MVKEKPESREIHLKKRPVGMPTENDFQLVKLDVPDLNDSEFLVRNIWLSVDPYMRGRMREISSTGTRSSNRPTLDSNLQ